jgi:hypothetical protein
MAGTGGAMKRRELFIGVTAAAAMAASRFDPSRRAAAGRMNGERVPGLLRVRFSPDGSVAPVATTAAASSWLFCSASNALPALGRTFNLSVFSRCILTRIASPRSPSKRSRKPTSSFTDFGDAPSRQREVWYDFTALSSISTSIFWPRFSTTCANAYSANVAEAGCRTS